MKYLLDTNILLHIVRNSKTWQLIDISLSPLDAPNEAYICFASVAELFSMATKLGWQVQKMNRLNAIFSNAAIIGVSGSVSDKLLESYVAIDTYSQGQHPILRLPKDISARNMGKNDIWIAATATALNATLITTDKDFAHLDGVFCKICIIEQVL